MLMGKFLGVLIDVLVVEFGVIILCEILWCLGMFVELVEEVIMG